jgi:hypothetical protein
MPLYVGISCLQSHWHGAAVSVESGRVALCGEPVVTELDKPRLFADLEQSTSLNEAGSTRSTEQEIIRQVYHDLELTNVGEKYYEFPASLPQPPNCSGVAHPYGLSPVVRRALTAVFDSAPVSTEIRSEKDVLPESRNENGRPQFCALETPLAIVLSEIFFGKLNPRSGTRTSIVVISPGSSQWEITAIQIVPALDSIALLVTAFAEWSVSEGVERVDRILTDWDIPSGTSIVVVGNLSGSELGSVTAVAELQIRTVSEVDVARGVALYGALCDEQRLTSSIGTLAAIDCRLIAPYAVGICQTGNGGADSQPLYWCPLVEAGAPLGHGPIAVRTEPADAFLAECVSTTRQPSQWVTGTKDLRWHSYLETPAVQENEGGTMDISIHGSAGCLNYGWSDPFVELSLRS